MGSYAVIDLHCDTLTSFLQPNSYPCNTLDFSQAALSLSALPKEVHWCQCFAIFTPDGLSPEQAMQHYDTHSSSFFRQMAHFSDQIVPCRTAGDIQSAWAAGKTAALLTVENGCVLAGNLDRVERLVLDGVKLFTLTWNGKNEIASGVGAKGGLSPFGRALIPVLESNGILLDVSHLNDQSFWEVLSVAQRPLVATHSNARTICPHPRNLTDDQIRALVERGCLIGLNYYTKFLQADGIPTPEDLLHHVFHFLDLGAEHCLALGSDFDGADLPSWLNTPTKVVGLFQHFRAAGLSSQLCQKIFYQNALHFFQKHLCNL
ncbi:MAG: dipeptidase [Lawsonibacter sp.]|jgi:membrane dipeptidase